MGSIQAKILDHFAQLTLFRLGRGKFPPPVKHSQISKKTAHAVGLRFFSTEPNLVTDIL